MILKVELYARHLVGGVTPVQCNFCCWRPRDPTSPLKLLTEKLGSAFGWRTFIFFFKFQIPKFSFMLWFILQLDQPASPVIFDGITQSGAAGLPDPLYNLETRRNLKISIQQIFMWRFYSRFQHLPGILARPRPYHRCRATEKDVDKIVFVLVILMRSLHNEFYGEYSLVTSRWRNSCRVILSAHWIW